MRTSSLFCLSLLGLIATGDAFAASSDGFRIDAAAPASSCALPGARAVQHIPELGELLDNQPRDFDSERGWSEYRLEDGKRALFLTLGDSDADLLSGDRTSPAASASLMPAKDTWTTLNSAGARVDFGRSCELQVNNKNSTAAPARQALLQFNIPTGVTCSTITSARLILKTGDNKPASPMRVGTYMLTSAFTPGVTGYSSCSTCKITTGASANMANFTYSTPGGVTTVSEACSTYVFDITAMAQTWCATPSRNFGVLVTGLDTTSLVDFHSMESPVAGDRPTLQIVY